MLKLRKLLELSFLLFLLLVIRKTINKNLIIKLNDLRSFEIILLFLKGTNVKFISHNIFTLLERLKLVELNLILCFLLSLCKEILYLIYMRIILLFEYVN